MKGENRLLNGYEPTVSVSTTKYSVRLNIKVKDNGEVFHKRFG
jgi:hypothetical protein